MGLYWINVLGRQKNELDIIEGEILYSINNQYTITTIITCQSSSGMQLWSLCQITFHKMQQEVDSKVTKLLNKYIHKNKSNQNKPGELCEIY